MSHITLSVSGNDGSESIDYAYKCREAEINGGKLAKAVIPEIKTEVSLKTYADDATAYIKEGYAFSPMFTLGFRKKLAHGEAFTTGIHMKRA